MLRKSFRLVLNKRRAWRIQRLSGSTGAIPPAARERIAASAPPPGCFATTTGRSPPTAPSELHVALTELTPARVLLDPGRLCRRCGGRVRSRDRMTRLAVVLAGLVLSLLVPSTAAAARSEFFGIVQRATLDDQDIAGDGRRPGPDEPLRAQLGLGAADPGLLQTGAQRTGSSAACHRTESGRSRPCGGTRTGWPGSGSTPPIGGPAAENAWRNFLKALVARYGPGGSYWANGYRQRVRSRRHAAADPVLADLERAQSEEVLRARRHRPASTPGCFRSPTTRSRAGIRRPGSCSPECPATGTWTPGTSSTASTRWPGSRTTSTPPPCTPTRPTSTSVRPAIQKFRE